MLWVRFKNFIMAALALIAGVLALFLGLQTSRAKRLKAEADGAKADAEKAIEHLDAISKSVSEAEKKRKQVADTEATLDNIKRETAEAVKTAQEIKTGDTIRFGKFVIIFAVLMLSACAPTLTECRKSFPCPENVCIAVTPPKLEALPRPQLTTFDVSYDNGAKAYLLTTEQIKALATNERVLVETIKGYEKIIAAYNAWRLKQ